MKHLLRLSSFLTLFFLFSMTASAQVGPPSPWTVVAGQAFDGHIHIVKFNGALGFPYEGFVGDSCSIWYTTNAGTSWTRSTITSPHNLLNPFLTGWVNDITFKDSLNGFAVIDSNYTGYSVPDAGVIITKDGGVTWSFDDTLNAPDSGRGIYYNVANGRLFVSSKDEGLVVSTDNGGTWSVIDTNKFYTGFAFNGNGKGVLATEGSNCIVFPTPERNYWLYTSDGGKTWQHNNMYTESWQPLGIPTTGTFFTSSGNYCGGTAQTIMRSDNNGYAFATMPGYTATTDTLTQSMAGDACMEFASSFSSHFGMWYSANDGATWSTILSSPTPPVNTRFAVNQSLVWSFTYDSLFHAARPTTADIHFWPDTIAFKNAACGKTSDTVVHIFGCNCANAITFVKDTIHHFNDTDSAPISGTITPATPPAHSLCSNGQGVADSLTINFSPVAGKPDTVDFHMIFTDNGNTVDTIVHMTANGVAAQLEIIPSGPMTMSGPACSGTIDSCPMIFNPSCSKIFIDNCTINEVPAQACQLQLTGCCTINNSSSPLEIDPGQSLPCCIDFQPGIIKYTDNASFQINWHSADTSGTTKLFIVTGNTTTGLKPSFKGFKDTVNSCCQVPADTTIFFVNTTCDTITLLQPFIVGKPPYKGQFIINTSCPLCPHFPEKLPPGQALHVPIDITCEGTDLVAVVTFPYSIAGYFNPSSSCANGLECSAFAFDSLKDTLIMDVRKGISAPALTPNQLSFGSVNCCDSTEVKTLTITGNCKDDTITGIRMNSNGNFYLISPLIDPTDKSTWIRLLPGSQQTIQVGFLPHCNGGSGATDKDTIAVDYTSDGFQKDSIVSTIIANSTNFATASISADTLDFGAVQECSAQTCQVVSFTNGSCSQVVMSVNQKPANAHFSNTPIGSGSFAVGDSVHDTICFNPSGTDTGAIGDLFIVQVCDPGGVSCTYDTVFLKGYIIAPIAGSAITAIPSATICDSQMIGETFTLTDTGTCYTYNIVSVSSGNPQVTITPQTATVTPTNAQTFNVTYMPTDTGTISGVITITNSDGTTETVPYTFSDTSCTGPVGKFTLTIPGDTIHAPNCTSTQLLFNASAGGGTGTVDSVTLSGSVRFSATSPTSGAMPYNGSVSFDPNPNGVDSAKLNIYYTINGTHSDTSLTVYGVITGVKDSARVGVIGLTSACIVPNDTMLDTFAVILRDSVPDALGVNKLSFLINYNGNLLFSPSSLGLMAPGWSLGSMKDTLNGVLVTLTYSGNSSGTTPANDTLIMITQKGAIGTSDKSMAKITNVHFNDSSFEACVLKALVSSSDSANICIDTTGCGGRLIRGVFNNTLQPFSGIEVVPNPVHKNGSAATLHFTTAAGAEVSADVLDVLGNSVTTLVHGSLEAGDHALAIPTGQMPEGPYFVRISAGGFTIIRQFVLEKE